MQKAIWFGTLICLPFGNYILPIKQLGVKDDESYLW